MTDKSIICAYCVALNPAGTNRCIACGAPIDIPLTPPLRVTTVEKPSNPSLDPSPVSQQLKEGLTAVGAGLGALGIWSVLFRTGAEALAIAFSAFLIGFTAGSASQALLGLGGGILVGLAVGLVVKRSWLTLISAPFGTLLGLAATYFVFLLSPSPLWSPLLATAGGVLFALLGAHRRVAGGVMNWYERVRPILGMTGGFIFAVLGYGLGSLLK